MRKKISELERGFYQYDEHGKLSDREARRYNPFSFDFNSTPLNLRDPDDHWDERVKRQYVDRRDQMVERLKLEHGTQHINDIINNTADLGPKSMSMLSYHNSLHEQSRRAFVIGAYYPSLVAACALGERILNHLVLDLRHSFRSSPHYKKVYRKKSLDDWPYAVSVLTDWEVLVDDVGADLLALGVIRNRSIHFNQNTYVSMRDDALAALKLIDKIIARQFGYFGSQPWFIQGTPGAQFVKRAYEDHPFVHTYIIPLSGLVGYLYGMEVSQEGYWHHLDYADYGDEALSDEDFAKKYRERDHSKVVSREMLEKFEGRESVVEFR